MKRNKCLYPLLTIALLSSLASCGGIIYRPNNSGNTPNTSNNVDDTSNTENHTSNTVDDTSKDSATSNVDDTSKDSSTSSKKEYTAPNYSQNENNSNLTKDNIMGSAMGWNPLPSTGNPKVLVIPVQTSDDHFSTDELSLIQKGFFGESDETGWESLSSYYEKASYGKLHISGHVTSTYNLNLTTYKLGLKKEDYVETILDNALQAKAGEVNLSEYDSNSDGYIDGVYLVYSPSMDNSGDKAIYWAWTSGSTSTTRYQGLYPSCYLWSSVDFLTEGYDANLGYTKNGKVVADSHTVIHESGHMLGLDDYYNYDDDNNEAPLGGVDMMDFNIGDHSAFSKFIQGWVDPILIDEDFIQYNGNTLTLNSFGKTGQCFIIPTSDYNQTPYDEYLMGEFYTPDGLNAKDNVPYTNGLPTFSDYGLLLYHVNASVGKVTITQYDQSGTWDKKFYNTIPNRDNWTSTNSKADFYVPVYSNSRSYCFCGDSYLTKRKQNTNYYRQCLYSLLCATGKKITITNNSGYATNDVLFKVNTSFKSKYSSFKFDDDSKPKYDFKITNLSSSNCIVEFSQF